MNAAELKPHELMQIVADFFESQTIRYGVVGSMASMAYGEPRFTSQKHLRDIAGMMKLQGDRLDRTYIGKWASTLGVADEWALVQQRVNE